MEEKRAKTYVSLQRGIPNILTSHNCSFDALSTFIQSQRTLLAKTNDDIERLKQLRAAIASYPSDDEDIVPHFLPQVCRLVVVDSCRGSSVPKIASTSKLSEQTEITAKLPDDLEWDIFASQGELLASIHGLS